MDLDVEFNRNGSLYRYRVVVLPGREKHMTRLATNLDRGRFPLEVVGRVYRFRWQVELCFKEWKSYANLHRFDSACEHIVEGLIWASLCAALLKRFLAHAAQLVSRVSMSTRRVAMCARHVIDSLFAALLDPTRALACQLRQGLRYLTQNARRAHPQRDLVTGRLRGGLVVVGTR